MIIAVIRAEKLQSVKDAVATTGVYGMTITRVTGRGSQMGLKFTNRVGEFVVDELEKIKVEIVTSDECVDKVVEAIIGSARTGHPGDGRIFIVPVEKSIKIRND